jgi:hypothetical protein
MPASAWMKLNDETDETEVRSLTKLNQVSL